MVILLLLFCRVLLQHFEGLKQQAAASGWKMGGALLSEVPQDDEPSSLRFVGSTLIVTAASKEDIVAQLERDVYAKNGVWDLEKVQMWPLKTAFRDP